MICTLTHVLYRISLYLLNIWVFFAFFITKINPGQIFVKTKCGIFRVVKTKCNSSSTPSISSLIVLGPLQSIRDWIDLKEPQRSSTFMFGEFRDCCINWIWRYACAIASREDLSLGRICILSLSYWMKNVFQHHLPATGLV